MSMHKYLKAFAINTNMKTDLVVAAYVFNKGKVLLIHHKKLNLWLPVGGHIDKDETPDEAIIREIKEETGLNAELIQKSNIPIAGNAKKSLALPFHANVHSVGDHDHCCLFYICKLLTGKIEIKKDELNNAEWFTKEDLQQERVPEDVRHTALRAFELHENR
ncbi:RNA pyrophosphohydrolase [uncultured archaeon]|nr:RNA pyrophosphohydrolase [uncultured archaeon]